MYVHDAQRKSGWKSSASEARTRTPRTTPACTSVRSTMKIVLSESVSVEARSTSNDSPNRRVHTAPHSTIALRLTAVKAVNWKWPVRA